jgi:hypothetical protein
LVAAALETQVLAAGHACCRICCDVSDPENPFQTYTVAYAAFEENHGSWPPSYHVGFAHENQALGAAAATDGAETIGAVSAVAAVGQCHALRIDGS